MNCAFRKQVVLVLGMILLTTGCASTVRRELERYNDDVRKAALSASKASVEKLKAIQKTLQDKDKIPDLAGRVGALRGPVGEVLESYEKALKKMEEFKASSQDVKDYHKSVQDHFAKKVDVLKRLATEIDSKDSFAVEVTVNELIGLKDEALLDSEFKILSKKFEFYNPLGGDSN